ncbi:uridine kinase family protein [Arthrobacter crystallopoietes]|uniref:uridine kinase family protein n=1 Tax=Crystallibacter crystallopoietes TaxID=37928 RepID=UPI0011115861|nr:uridine kinase [Arthrobacter crystallopoietes]QTG80275.1 uridine kinase [Arthrobacter crystallopoietes]
MPSPHIPLVLLGGASGSGKSYLAARFGRPHVELDSFYREISEHTPQSPLPQTAYEEIDWDHPDTWNSDAAARAMLRLLQTGSTQVPQYSIATSSYTGHRSVRLAEGPVIAEGIFADAVLAPLLGLGVPVEPIFIQVSPLTTAVRRLVRDLREHRKPVPFLLKRGWALFRAERRVRQRYLDAGFRPIPKRQVKRLLAAL